MIPSVCRTPAKTEAEPGGDEQQTNPAEPARSGDYSAAPPLPPEGRPRPSPSQASDPAFRQGCSVSAAGASLTFSPRPPSGSPRGTALKVVAWLTGATRQGRCAGSQGRDFQGASRPRPRGFGGELLSSAEPHAPTGQSARRQTPHPHPASPEPGQARRSALCCGKTTPWLWAWRPPGATPRPGFGAGGAAAGQSVTPNGRTGRRRPARRPPATCTRRAGGDSMRGWSRLAVVSTLGAASFRMLRDTF